MPDKAWKRMERQVAKKIGGERVVCSGVKGEGDVDHPHFFIECKYRKAFAAEKWFDDAKAKAKKYDKTPILVVKQAKRHGDLAIMDFDDLVNILRKVVDQQKGSV